MTLGFIQMQRLLGERGESGASKAARASRNESTFKTVWANDMNRYSVETYNRNFGRHCIPGDICELLEDSSVEIPHADVVIGGPPCQGFSLLNKNKNGDGRRQLWRPYFEVVRRSGARAFVMENVPQLLKSPEFWEITEAAEELGFRVRPGVLMAADFGVPQTRKRAFIFASRSGEAGEPEFPSRSHFNPRARRGNDPNLYGIEASEQDLRPWRTVEDAVADLPPPLTTEIRKDEAPPLDLHFGRSPTPKSKARYRAIPQPGMNREDLLRRAPHLTPRCWVNKKGGTDLFGRLWWDRPAVTIRTEFFKPEKGRYLHPEQHRPITHREAARFQSFPDDFQFEGTKIEIAKQIGNAVPPLLAASIADCIHRMLSEQ